MEYSLVYHTAKSSHLCPEMLDLRGLFRPRLSYKRWLHYWLWFARHLENFLTCGIGRKGEPQGFIRNNSIS